MGRHMCTHAHVPSATPAIAVLERERVPFRLHEYELDPRAESFGLEAAERLGVYTAHVFKTLVVAVDGGFAFALLPVDRQLDLVRLTGATIRPLAARRP
jgi:Cys-tRNA(Pro)/Cys-tRNA(Cys) deacylase